MSVTAIQNPLKSADVLLTYPTSKGNLALEHRPFPSGPDPSPFTDNGNSGGPIMTDSGVSVVAHDNDTVVYGIVQWTGTGSVVNRAIAVISPVINPLVSVTNSVTLASISPGNYTPVAAITDGADSDYVYFLQDPTGTTNAPFIQEVIVGADGSTNFSTYDQVPVNAQSNLAGAYDPGTGRRHTFYQNPKGTICWVNHVDRSPVPIRSTTAAKIGTPITVSTVVDQSNGMTVYLYFYDQQFNLWKAVHKPDKSEDTWNDAHPVGTSNPVKNGSGLVAVPDVQAQANLVYYIQSTSGSVFKAYKDPFVSDDRDK